MSRNFIFISGYVPRYTGHRRVRDCHPKGRDAPARQGAKPKARPRIAGTRPDFYTQTVNERMILCFEVSMKTCKHEITHGLLALRRRYLNCFDLLTR